MIATFESSPVRSCCASNLAKNFSFGEYDKGTLIFCKGFPLESNLLILILLDQIYFDYIYCLRSEHNENKYPDTFV